MLITIKYVNYITTATRHLEQTLLIIDQMGKPWYMSITTHCILAKFAWYYVCMKRRLPTWLYAMLHFVIKCLFIQTTRGTSLHNLAYDLLEKKIMRHTI